MTAGALNIPNLHALRHVALLRIISTGEKGRSVAALRRDLYPFVAPKLSTAEWKVALADIVEALVSDSAIGDGDNGWPVATPKGWRVAEQYLAVDLRRSTSWLEIKSIYLIAKALGLPTGRPARLKAIGQVRGLRSAVLIRHYGLRLKGKPSDAKLRNALAVKALERAFGRGFGSKLGASASVPGRTGRLIAAQLAHTPRLYDNDQKLIAELAAEATGAVQTDLSSLRLALMRALVLGRESADIGNEGTVGSSGEREGGTPNLAGFSKVINTMALHRARGWPGNRKAYISDVWQSVREAHPEWGFSEGEFKTMLTEAHRAGHLKLANADLRDKSNIGAVLASATKYKNTEWHLIRVEG